MQIKLDKIQQTDLEKLRRWRMSNHVTKYMITDPVITAEDQIEWYKKINTQTNMFYWVIKCDNIEIGFFSITNIDIDKRSCEVGHYIGEKEYCGKGIGKIIEANICKYVFEELKLDTIIFDIFEENIPAYKLHEAFGAVEDTSKKKEIMKHNCKHKIIRLCIEREVWQQQQKNKMYPTIEIN